MPKCRFILAKTWSIKIHFDNTFLTQQKNLIHTEVKKWPNEFEIQHLEKLKVKVLRTFKKYFEQ